MNQPQYDVIVIGGGASGMMAAATAGARALRVLLLEKNPRLGAKLAITGGGRCNITNSEPDAHAFLARYGDARDFLYSPFSQFSNLDTVQWFESRGLPLKTEALGRMFPASERAIDVVRVLEEELRKGNVEVRTGVRVLKLQTNLDTDPPHPNPLLSRRGDSASPPAAEEKLQNLNSISSVVTDQGTFTAKSFVVATGGMSHPETGSTGDGFDFLRGLGHTVATPTPTIVPLAVSEKWITALSGVSVPEAKITYYCDCKKAFSKKGPLLFTHFGISGPTVLNSAKQVADLLHTGMITAQIDLYPNFDLGALEKHILAIFDANKNKTFKTIIREVMSIGGAGNWAPVFAALGLSPELLETKVHSVSRDDRKALVRIAKGLPLTITGLMGFDRAVVADGGVVLSEVDMKTMRSKLFSNLHITGDLLHINRPSGGFSLQLCWTSGFVAGSNV